MVIFNTRSSIICRLAFQKYSTGDFSISMEHVLHNFLRPVLDEGHVDCIMYGHDHNYQLFWTDRDPDWGGSKYFVCNASGGPQRIEYKILGANKGKTIHIWLGLTYSYERDGIIPDSSNGAKQKMHRIISVSPICSTLSSNGAKQKMHRMDEMLKKQIYGVHVVSKKRLGKDYELMPDDIARIVTAAK